MLLRAAFWIGVVSVLMPHEPNLGYGSPSLGKTLSTKLSNWTGGKATAEAPTADHVAATHGPRTLAQVKAEIAAARHPL
jgi:hypothetical protein